MTLLVFVNKRCYTPESTNVLNTMKFVPSARAFSFGTIIAILICAVLLWISVCLYGIFYLLYIPTVAHVHPIYLQYDSGCRGRTCKYPSANVSLVKPGYTYLLAGKQEYAVEVSLEMPESEANMQQGMFMIKLAMASKTGKILRSSSRPAALHYRSPLLRTIYTVLFSPVLLVGTFAEMQKLVVPLFECYIEDSYNPTHFAIIEIQACFVEIYSCKLEIHAQFSGIRYYMYYWPLLSAIVGIGSTFFLLCTITLTIWIRYIVYSPMDEVSSTKKKGKKTSLSSHSKHISSSPAGMTKPLINPGGGNEQQDLPPVEEKSGVEVLSAGTESLDLQPITEPDEESDLVVTLRKKNR